MRSACSVLFVCCLLLPACAEEPVRFPDPNVKAAVESYLWLSDPKPSDMLALTGLCATHMAITDLGGLEYAVNLQTLSLNNNALTIIAPLSSLVNLQELWLNQNQISDMSPLCGLGNLEVLILDNNQISHLPGFSGMTSLRCLDLHDNDLTDISAVSAITGLEALILRHNQIRELSGLSALKDLEELNLIDNQIDDLSGLAGAGSLRTLLLQSNKCADLSPLAGLSELRTLNLCDNNVSDISALANLSNLQTLILHRNEVRDISALVELDNLEYLGLQANPLQYDAYGVHLPKIIEHNPDVLVTYDALPQYRWSISSTAGGAVVQPGEGQITFDKGQTVRFCAEARPRFAFVAWSGTFPSQRESFWYTVNRKAEIRAHFVSLLAVIYVDDDAVGDPEPGDLEASDPQENGTAKHPFDSIQEAIEVAADGASIVVQPGVYRENIDFLGKSIQLVGIDPNDPNDASFPVLDGLGDGPVVTFTNGEDSNCVLMGFVITRGQGDPAGAIYCEGSRPTVANCLIVGNRGLGPAGAAVSCVNSAAAFVNCTLADNVGGAEGGGIIARDSDVIVTNSILWGNVPAEVVVRGASAPSITYTDVTGGWPGEGNLDVDPLFVRHGRWTDPQDPNTAVSPYDADVLWLDGDYHLRSQAGRWDGARQTWFRDEATSPCIDAGDPAVPLGAEPAPNGGVVNTGAYGGTTESSQSPLSYGGASGQSRSKL